MLSDLNSRSTSDDSEDLDSGRVDWDRVLEYVEASSARLGDSMEARTAEGNGQDRRYETYCIYFNLSSCA